MSKEILKVVAIGNSKGIRIPSEILRRQQIEKEVECVETPDGLLLRAAKSDQLSFEDAFAELAHDREALAEASELEAAAIGDGLEEDY